MPRRKKPCPNLAAHTREPPWAGSYGGWDDWAAAMSITHDQQRCTGCGLYAIWVPKPGSPTIRAIIATAEHIAHGTLMPDCIDDLGLSPREHRNALGLVRFILISEAHASRRRAMGPMQKRAMALLRTYLTPEQRRQLASRRCFYVTTGSGNTYRLWPKSGVVQHVVRHGKLWFEDASFCYHDPDSILPKADVTLGHLLILASDEATFLADANRTEREHMGWNGDWLRRVRRQTRRTAELRTDGVPPERREELIAEAADDIAFYEARLGHVMDEIGERIPA